VFFRLPSLRRTFFAEVVYACDLSDIRECSGACRVDVRELVVVVGAEDLGYQRAKADLHLLIGAPRETLDSDGEAHEEALRDEMFPGFFLAAPTQRPSPALHG
jgi:hypothetical protein